MLLKEHYQEMYGKLHEASYSLSKAAELMGSGDKDEQWDAAIALTGGNIRATSLKKNEIYIMRERNTSHHFNYSMDRFPVIFLGSGKGTYDQDANKTKYDWFGANKKLKTMDYGEYYYFKGAEVNRSTGKFKRAYMFGAYEWRGALAIGSGANKVSLYKFDSSEAKNYGVDQ